MTDTPERLMPLAADGALEEVVELCQELIAIDTSNTGETQTSAGERVAAEYVAAKLADVGLEPQVFESEPKRTSLVVRIPGADRSRGGLLVHGHLDVVPAEPSEWSVHPFSGEVKDGFIWGRGAVDMKDMDAMTLAVVRRWLRDGVTPPRDIVVAFLADEEAGGAKGAGWLVQKHPELFEGVTEAISEVGGFSMSVTNDLRLYLIETAEKGLGWMRLKARGLPGHGSMVHQNNAVTALAEAVSRLGRHEFPIVLTDTVKAFLEAVGEALGIDIDLDEPEIALSKLGGLARMVGATLRNTANPTMLDAGYKANVVPSSATAVVDGRFLPGQSDIFEAELDEILGPDIEREWIAKHPAVETSFDGELVDAMAAALKAEDPGARAVPYMLSGGTDAKSFAQLGIRNFGFAPLRLPPDLDFSALFHGIDERVPVDGLRFGARVLDRFLLSS